MKDLNFLFVALKVASASEPHAFPYGMAYVTAYMKEKGYKTYCLDLSFSDESVHDQLKNAISLNKIDVVCTGGMSIEYAEINEILEEVRLIDSRLLTVVGGAIITSDPKTAMESMPIDYGVKGEGEETMVELAESLCQGKGAANNVNGVIYRDSSGALVYNPDRGALKELDTYPLPDYEGFELGRHLDLMLPNSSGGFEVMDEVRAAAIITSRSCPFSCTFCYHPLGKKYRQKSLSRVFQEIDLLVTKYGVNAINIMDDLFSVKKERMFKFAEQIKHYGIPWVAQLRVNDVDPIVLARLKDSGLLRIGYGIENVDKDVLVSMKKKITPEQINVALKITREAKIGITGNILFGDPEDTEQSIKTSLKWWKAHPEYDLNLNPIITVPDAPIFQQAVKRGLIKDKLEFMKNKFPIINLTNIPEKRFWELISLIYRYQGDNNFKTRGYVLASTKTGRDTFGKNLYSIHIKCPECAERMTYRNFHQNSVQRYFAIYCKSCLRRFYIDTLKCFPDNFSLWGKIRFAGMHTLSRVYHCVPFLRPYVERTPILKGLIRWVKHTVLGKPATSNVTL